MVETLAAEKLKIIDVERKFALTQTNDKDFFTEWFDNLPELNEGEKALLDRTKSNYLSLIKRREISENMVKISVIGPLLVWTDFYKLPFDIVDEKTVELAVQNEDEVVRGRLDIMVVRDNFWFLTIESKNAGLSLLNGIPQALFYMVSNPTTEHNTFGLVTNGDDFQFIKLSKEDSPRYALSNKFFIYNQQENDLYQVLKVLKSLSGSQK